ncbi:MAG: site-2 protease family protein, partial [bacterium]|nr:site-2 protease family protein [bacterium]
MFKRLCMVCARVPWRLLFFLLTIGTTWLAGGWMYAVCVIAFFGAHEMGHYLMARHYGMEVTLPMFLPMPNILGTMGAFIGIRSPFMNRRELFDVGVAGPLSGLVVAIPLSVVGIWLTSPSEVPL